MGSSTKVRLLLTGQPKWHFDHYCSQMLVFVATRLLILFPFRFGSSADRCIQNIYRQLRQETATPKKYPGVLASLLMLDKLSIEDIKASVTELMAGGVDTVRIKAMMTKINAFQDTTSFHRS